MADDDHLAVRQLQQALARRDRAAVNAAAAVLIARRAPLGSQWRAVSAALLHNGEVEAALAAVDLLVDAANASAAARFVRSSVLAQSDRLGAALAELDAIPGAEPDPASHAYLRGTIALNQGDRDAAQAAFRSALEAKPDSGQIWLARAELADFAADPDLGARLERAWSAPPADPDERAQLAYAVGRKRHALGDHERAFAAFEAGAAARRQALGGRRAAEDSPPAFPPELIERCAAMISIPHERVIFVSGLPRSGTTLVEQVLVSHSDVTAGGELGFFRILGEEIGGVDAASLTAWLDRGGDPNALVALYLHLADQRLGRRGRFVDKTVEAGRYMGLLLALFPRAPIFWMRREPIDNGWSAFRTYFVRGAAWSWDLPAIGRRQAQEDQLIAYWSRAAEGRIHFLDYGALVRDPEPHIVQIAKAAGLTLEEAMLRPHETRRVVSTASVSQVRQPINLKGLGVADPYRAWLGPMIEAYQAATVTRGSSATG